LELAVNMGDTLRWRTCSPTTCSYVVLYQINLEPELTTTPTMSVKSCYFPLPDPTNPTCYINGSGTDVFFSCNVKGYGQQRCQLCFYIVNSNTDGILNPNPTGYFSWETTLTLSSTAHNIADVNVFFDIQHLIANYTLSEKPDNPTCIDASDAYMGTQSKYVEDVNGNMTQATEQLVLQMKLHDRVRWRAQSIADNSSQAAILYNIGKKGGDDVLDIPRNQQTSYAQVIGQQVETPIPEEKDSEVLDATIYTPIEQYDFYIDTIVQASGTEEFKVYFYVTDIKREQGKPTMVTKGYFYWTPTLHVSAE